MHQPFRIPRFVVVGDDLDGAVWKIMDHSKQENHDVYKTIPLAYGEKEFINLHDRVCTSKNDGRT